MTEGIEVTLPDGQVFPSIRQASKHVPYSESVLRRSCTRYTARCARGYARIIAGMMCLGLGSLREK